jgi:hypothetical protein
LWNNKFHNRTASRRTFARNKSNHGRPCIWAARLTQTLIRIHATTATPTDQSNVGWEKNYSAYKLPGHPVQKNRSTLYKMLYLFKIPSKNNLITDDFVCTHTCKCYTSENYFKTVMAVAALAN